MTEAARPFGPDVILRHGLGLARIADTNPTSCSVATCGDWDLGDLTWHLGEVQDFWLHVIEQRPAEPEAYKPPSRPPDDGLATLLRDRCRRLAELLETIEPTEPAWSWSGDRTVGFTVRRQSHEAMIHHVDAVLATGADLPDIDPALAADGVDEVVRVMLCGVPDWARYAPSEQTLLVSAIDTGHSWPLELGRMTGTSPATGNEYDLTAFRMLDDLDAPSTVIEGAAVELDLWLWGRSDGAGLRISGDPAGSSLLRDAIAESTQ